MVNSRMMRSATSDRNPDLASSSRVVVGYLCLTVATIFALGVLSAVAPDLATDDAWGHAMIVVVFAILLPLRMRAARNGSARAVRAVAVIAGVLLAVNVVEAALPGAFPVWMRVEMVVVAVLMAVLLALVTGRVRGTPQTVHDEAAHLR
jgi:hypothetical protein